MYVIQFKSRGVETMVWSGYTSREEALREAKEADLIIPIAWTWDILTEAAWLEELARQYEEEYYEKKETA